jgi:hypothetical protein
VVGVVGGALLALASACGPFLEDVEDQGSGGVSGPICYSNSDCVPDGCCGQATAAVHVLEARGCSHVRCTGTCPSHMTHCGCGLPVCRDGRCTVALRHDSQCP